MLLSQSHRDIYNILFEKKTALKKKHFKWDEIIKSGSSHLVLPLIKYKIEKLKIKCPNELSKYLNYINNHNQHRNAELFIELNIIDKLFKKLEIEYLVLKGSALLLGEYFKNKSNRMIGDIDILIREKDYEKCKKNLEFIGYNSSENFNLLNHRHYPRMSNKKKFFAIELHTELLRDKYNNLLPAEKIFNDKINTKYNIPIPSKKHLFLHAIYNHQINDYGFLKCSYDFRTLYDLYILKTDLDIQNIVIPKFLTSYLIINNIFENKYVDLNRGYFNKIYRARFLAKLKNKIYYKIDKIIIDQLILLIYRYKLLKDILINKDLRKNTLNRIFKIN